MCQIDEIAKKEAVKIYKNNQDAIELANNPKFHKRTKHIDIRCHFVREKIKDS